MEGLLLSYHLPLKHWNRLFLLCSKIFSYFVSHSFSHTCTSRSFYSLEILSSLFFRSMFGPFIFPPPPTYLIISCKVSHSESLEVNGFWVCVSIHFYPTLLTGTSFSIHTCQASNTNSPWKSCLSSSITMCLFNFNLSDHCVKTKKCLIKLPMCAT